MDTKIVKLAMDTMWCDIKHSFRGYKAVLLVSLFAFTMIPPGSTTFMLAYVVELAMMSLLPECGRIYFILPMSAADRKRMLVYRQIFIEFIFLVLILASACIRSLIYYGQIGFLACVVSNVMTMGLMLFETGSACSFCGWYKKASLREKGFGILFGILLWVAFCTAAMLAEYDNVITIASWIAFLSCAGLIILKLYYMVHATFEEYKVTGNVYANVRAKRDMADERF